jgi:Two component regulator propeller
MRRVPICFLAFLGAAAPALAQYHFDSWTTDNGLPHNSINSMLQSHEGYLWLATQRLPSECLADSGTALGLIPEATLVCRDEHNNLLLVTLESGERRLLGPAPAGFPFHLLGVRIFQDREGTLWVGTGRQGLYRARKHLIKTYSKEEGLRDRNVYPVYQDHAGAIWIGA